MPWSASCARNGRRRTSVSEPLRLSSASTSALNRLERFGLANVPLARLVEIAAVLGLDVSIRLHRVGDPIHDNASQGLIGRFLRVVSAGYRVTREALLPSGGQRSWDVLLRLAALLVGVELVTRVRDVQALVRLIRLRERDGGVDHVLLVLPTALITGQCWGS